MFPPTSGFPRPYSTPRHPHEKNSFAFFKSFDKPIDHSTSQSPKTFDPVIGRPKNPTTMQQQNVGPSSSQELYGNHGLPSDVFATMTPVQSYNQHQPPQQVQAQKPFQKQTPSRTTPFGSSPPPTAPPCGSSSNNDGSSFSQSPFSIGVRNPVEEEPRQFLWNEPRTPAAFGEWPPLTSTSSYATPFHKPPSQPSRSNEPSPARLDIPSSSGSPNGNSMATPVGSSYSTANVGSTSSHPPGFQPQIFGNPHHTNIPVGSASANPFPGGSKFTSASQQPTGFKPASCSPHSTAPSANWAGRPTPPPSVKNATPWGPRPRARSRNGGSKRTPAGVHSRRQASGQAQNGVTNAWWPSPSREPDPAVVQHLSQTPVAKRNRRKRQLAQGKQGGKVRKTNKADAEHGWTTVRR